jgi:uncharacterized protein YfaA (DUF2138 family)
MSDGGLRAFGGFAVGSRVAGYLLEEQIWAAPRFPDSLIDAISCCELPVQVLVVDFLRSLIAEC